MTDTIQEVITQLSHGPLTLAELHEALGRTDLWPVVSNLMMTGVLVASSHGDEHYYETTTEYEPSDEHYCCGCWQCLPDVF